MGPLTAVIFTVGMMALAIICTKALQDVLREIRDELRKLKKK